MLPKLNDSLLVENNHADEGIDSPFICTQLVTS